MKTSGGWRATCSIGPLTRHRRERPKKNKKTASHINEEGQDIRKNPHDAFVNLDIAIYIAVRSSDPLAD